MRECVKVYLSTGATGVDGKGLGEVRECANGEVLKLGDLPDMRDVPMPSKSWVEIIFHFACFNHLRH